MKAIGIVRPLDRLGRVVLPKELRKTMNIVEDVDSLEIFVEGDKIILRKYAPSCIFCGQAHDMTSFKGKNVCPDCIKQLKAR